MKNRYCFHNIYGDAEEFLKSLPPDVIKVPFGWSEEAEQNRNNILKEMGLSGVSCLPCIVEWREPFITVNDGVKEYVQGQWVELRLERNTSPWSWIKSIPSIEVNKTDWDACTEKAELSRLLNVETAEFTETKGGRSTRVSIKSVLLSDPFFKAATQATITNDTTKSCITSVEAIKESSLETKS